MQLINLTAHDAVIYGTDGLIWDDKAKCYHFADGVRPVPILIVAPSGTVARCRAEEETLEAIEVEGVHIPACGLKFGEIEGLPDPQEGVLYFVSALVATAGRAQGRTDLAVPAKCIRTPAGEVKGCTALATR